jgi:hypothetical protein
LWDWHLHHCPRVQLHFVFSLHTGKARGAKCVRGAQLSTPMSAPRCHPANAATAAIAPCACPARGSLQASPKSSQSETFHKKRLRTGCKGARAGGEIRAVHALCTANPAPTSNINNMQSATRKRKLTLSLLDEPMHDECCFDNFLFFTRHVHRGIAGQHQHGRSATLQRGCPSRLVPSETCSARFARSSVSVSSTDTWWWQCAGDDESDDDDEEEEAIVALMLLLKEKADRERLQAAMTHSQAQTVPDLKRARRTSQHSNADSATDGARKVPCSVKSHAARR